jgi:hypothetical protein
MFSRNLLSQLKGQREEEEEEEQAAGSSKILSVTSQIAWCYIPVTAMETINVTYSGTFCHDTEPM